MKKEELWKILSDKNTAFSGSGEEHITQTKRGLKKLFDLAFEQGHEEGVKNGRAAEAMDQEKKRKTGSDESLFGRIFGDRI